MNIRELVDAFETAVGEQERRVQQAERKLRAITGILGGTTAPKPRVKKAPAPKRANGNGKWKYGDGQRIVHGKKGCSKCHQWKPKSNFYGITSGKNASRTGLMSMCKPCFSGYAK